MVYLQKALRFINELRRCKWLALGALFALCIAPTFISYQPYLFGWDDSNYLRQCIEVSRAFWSGNVHGLGAMGGIRPPAMALLGLPWGRLTSWEAAGDCFISLAVLTSLVVTLCLYQLLRIGVKPFALLTAGLCVLASIGPYPHATSFMNLNPMAMAAAAHFAATAFLADSLFAWTALAAVLLVPYEAKTVSLSTRAAVLHGSLWGLVLSLGVMTKLNFLYFVVLVLPVLLFITRHQSGVRCAFAALVGFTCSSAPSTFYLSRWGGPAFENLKASSFGGVAHSYWIPTLQFLGLCIRESPGLVLSFTLTLAGLSYVTLKRRVALWSADSLALAIMIGFGAIVLAATNKQIRLAFPVIVAVPFLTAILMSRKGDSVPRRSAAVVVGLVFCGLVAAGVPMRRRADVRSISRCDAILAKAAACKAQNVIIATDSPTLNHELMELAAVISRSRTSVKIDSLAWNAANDTPIEEDFRKLSSADQVVFQDANVLSPPFTNVRAAAYEQYVRQSGTVATSAWADVSVYPMRCGPR